MVRALIVMSACADAKLAPSPTQLRLEPRALDFGAVELGRAKTLTVAVTNASARAETATPWAPEPFRVSSSVGLEPGQTVNLDVTFAPSTAGPMSGELVLSFTEGFARATLEGVGLSVTTAECGPDGTECSATCLIQPTCQGGVCRGAARNCDDADPCTLDVCEPVIGCSHVPVSCGNSGPCEAARCDPLEGCRSEPLPDGTACGPRTCAEASVCLAGRCMVRPTPTVSACALALSADMSTCAVVTGGRLSCWGHALGEPDGGTVTRPEARLQWGLPLPVTAVSVGSPATCAVAAGAAYCWGWRDRGVLGVPGTGRQTMPTQPPHLPSPVTDIAVGNDHVCAIASGQVWCWGANTWGALGDGTVVDRWEPRRVGTLSAVQVSAGDGFTCARDGSGVVWCWGKNAWGTLGDTTQTQSLTPVRTALPQAAVQLSSGWSHSCAVTADGSVYCWGYGWKGKLGDGLSDSSHFASVPVKPTGLPRATRVVASNFDTCAIDISGLAWCWGRNTMGSVGNGTTTEREVPVRVQGLSGVTAIATGVWHTCASHLAGVSCWGGNESGQLGTGLIGGQSLSPVPVRGL